MGAEEYGVNLRLTSIYILADVESFLKLCESIIEIRRLLDYSGKVVLEEVTSLTMLEQKVGVNLPKWVIGLSAGERIWILKKSEWQNQKMDVSQLILHEFVHIALGHRIRRSVPIWLNEGLAVYLSGQYKDYKLEQSHIRTWVDFYGLSYESEHLYVVAAKTLIALVREYSLSGVIKELFSCEEFETSRLFHNENLNRVVQEYETWEKSKRDCVVNEKSDKRIM